VSQREDDKQAVDGLCGTNHEGLESQIHFLLLKHDLNFPAMGIMGKDFLIRKAEIRADEHAQRLFAAKGIFGIGEQDNSIVNSVKRPFITMEPILVAAHCNKVVLVVWEHGSVILGAAAVTVRIKDAIGFHCANEGDLFLKRLVPQSFAGIPAVHLEDNTGICFGQRVQKLNRHVDPGAAFRAAAAQTIAQRKVARTDIGAKHLITEHLLPLQMRIVPARSLHGPRGPRGRLLLLYDRIIYAQVDGKSLRHSQFICFPQCLRLLLLGYFLLISFAFGQKMAVSGPKPLI